MKKIKSTTYIWAIAIALIALGVFLTFNQKDSATKGVAEQVSDTAPESITEPDGSTAKTSPEAPYLTTGENAEDSNFFIPGRVESLTSLISQDKNSTIVWVSAPGCHVCQQMRPWVWQSMNKYSENVSIKEIDLEKNLHIARDYQILGTPTFFILDKKGNILSRFNGATQATFENQLVQASKVN